MSCPMKQNECQLLTFLAVGPFCDDTLFVNLKYSCGCQLLNAIITQPEHLRVTVIEQRIRAQGVEHLNDNDASS